MDLNIVVMDTHTKIKMLEEIRELIVEGSPYPIQALVKMYLDGEESLRQATARQEYLEKEIEKILATDPSSREVTDYLCPTMPKVTLIRPEVVDKDVRVQLYKVAKDEGWHLLTKLEASFFQKGVSVGINLNKGDNDAALIALAIVSLGQDISNIQQSTRK